MNTPAISGAARPVPFVPAHLSASPQPRPARPGPAAEVHPAAAPRTARRPAVPRRNPGWEILAGVLLLVVWTMLWSLFLNAVVEPGAALQRQSAEPAAAASARWVEP